jgi:23S rRNA (adenine2503-C2)-methyltransferase
MFCGSYLKERDLMDKFDIRSAYLEEICSFVENLGEKPFRGTQIFEWINAKFANSFDEMSNLSLGFRQKLKEYAEISSVGIINKQISGDNSTKKYLLEMQDYGMMKSGSVRVEAVLMSYKHGLTACLSTQAGCRMGCDFCLSGESGLERNLTAGEIAAQYYLLSKDAGERISNVVLMGVGEPLDNYDNVIRFIKLINHPKGVNLGQRHITLSTCGLADKIYQLAKEELQINLAVSLHAPNNQIRRQLMPVARQYSVEELLKAVREYAQNGRRVTFEYIAIAGINDKEPQARELAKVLKGLNCHINLIPANKHPMKGYNKSSAKALGRFKEILEEEGFKVTVRRELGADISAACGQLRLDG